MAGKIRAIEMERLASSDGSKARGLKFACQLNLSQRELDGFENFFKSRSVAKGCSELELNANSASQSD